MPLLFANPGRQVFSRCSPYQAFFPLENGKKLSQKMSSAAVASKELTIDVDSLFQLCSLSLMVAILVLSWTEMV